MNSRAGSRYQPPNVNRSFSMLPDCCNGASSHFSGVSQAIGATSPLGGAKPSASHREGACAQVPLWRNLLSYPATQVGITPFCRKHPGGEQRADGCGRRAPPARKLGLKERGDTPTTAPTHASADDGTARSDGPTRPSPGPVRRAGVPARHSCRPAPRSRPPTADRHQPGG